MARLPVANFSNQGKGNTFAVLVPFAVNIGTTRPAITDIKTAIKVTEAYAAWLTVIFTNPNLAKCISMLATVNKTNIGTKNKLRYCLILNKGLPKI